VSSCRCWSISLGLAAALAATLAACAPPAETGPRRWNVVVVLLDTLRADHLGVHGYGRDTSPNLDAFAAGNVLFTHNWSQASCTWPSVNSLLTSRWPQRFWGRKWGLMGIPEGIPSLAEILTAHGWASVAVSASPIVRENPSWANKEGGFERGFAVFHEQCSAAADAACINAQAFGHMGLLRRPFFLYLHYMETHNPYQPPPDWPRRFAGAYQGDKWWVRDGNVGPVARMLYHDGPPVEVSADELAHMIALYDDELAYFDHRFGELLAELRRLGLEDDTLVVFLSDHGESFLEHDDFTHCRSVWESEVRVPLILRVPGVAGPVRIEQPVANLDVAPTILDYLGIDAAPYGFEGTSLRPLIEGRSGGETNGRPELAFSVIGQWRSAADGRFKLIADLGGNVAPRLYDLDADPGEEVDVLDRERRAYRRLSGGLEEWLAALEPDARGRRNLERAEEPLRQLQAVGYLQGGRA
jgi:arylsulfatase A-like enzyme